MNTFVCERATVYENITRRYCEQVSEVVRVWHHTSSLSHRRRARRREGGNIICLVVVFKRIFVLLGWLCSTGESLHL